MYFYCFVNKYPKKYIYEIEQFSVSLGYGYHPLPCFTHKIKVDSPSYTRNTSLLFKFVVSISILAS